MSARTVVSMLAVALLLAGCSQDYTCTYYCGTSTIPIGDVSENGGDPDSVAAECEKDRASACTTEEAPTRCHCTADNPDLSPGTNHPSFPRAAGAES